MTLLRFFIIGFAFVAFVISSQHVKAGVLVDLDLTSIQNTLTSPSVMTVTSTVYSLGVYGGIDSREAFYFGAYYLGSSYSDAAATTTSFGSTDLGIALKWYMDKNHIFSLTAGYAYSSKGSYSPPGGATSQDWSGSSMLGKLSMEPDFGKMNLGVSILYYSASYTAKTVGTVASSASNASTYLVPALGFAYKW